MTGDLTGRLRDAHPLQYGWLAASPREMVMHTETVPDGIVDRMNRCPVCEQWSPCDVRGALDRITALEAREAYLIREVLDLRLDHEYLPAGLTEADVRRGLELGIEYERKHGEGSNR
ncbi:MAG: hypothetical protein GY925_13150 [Actinomycetia bacterium]|nr:hypothetical protein [Actinomycetes bacterium]